jgi:type VI secretion system secreted protein VgrG
MNMLNTFDGKTGFGSSQAVAALFPDRLSQHTRTLSATSPALPNFMGTPVLVPTRLSGEEGLCELFTYQLELKTPEDLVYSPSLASNIPLAPMAGREIHVAIELVGKGSSPSGTGVGADQRQLNALITQARYLRPEGRHHVYGLTLRPWLWLATLNQTCRIFQDQTVVQTLDAVLANYPFPVAKRLSVSDYPVRDYQVQYNESDFAFFVRLCETWGISWWFEHAEGAHRLVLADGMGAYPTNPSAAYSELHYYPPGHKADEEYISRLHVAEAIATGAWASADTDYTRAGADLAVSEREPRGSSNTTGHANAEVFAWPVDTAQPKAGAGGLSGAANDPLSEGAQFARMRLQALQAPAHRAQGHGNLRGLVTGYTFKLSKHPQDAANIEWLVLSTQLDIEEVAQESQGSASDALGQLVPAQRWRCVVDFTVQPTSIAYRPALTSKKPVVAGFQRATVTGPKGGSPSGSKESPSGSNTESDKELWTDAYGRVKVVFPWDREHPLREADQTASCWLRVSAAWAGNQYGGIHIPRVGQEVIVEFENGDPDRPLITGRVVNNQNMAPWRLPDNQALSGLRSKELNGAQHNHLVLDDTEGGVQAQLSSDQHLSQLNLGKVVRIPDNRGRTDKRGDGFELRTDAHGVVRAKEGLLITTEGRPDASGHIKSMGETTARLEQAAQTHEQLADLAKQHRAQEAGQQDEVAKALDAQNKALKGTAQLDAQAGKFPELEQPHLTLASPTGIQATTAGSTHLHSGEHLAITTGESVSVASGKGFWAHLEKGVRIFAHKFGMHVSLGKNDISMQALQDSIRLVAALNITETAEGNIMFSAKEALTVQGGTSGTTWKNGGIENFTEGSFEEKASSFSFGDPKGVEPVEMPKMPVQSLEGDHQTTFDTGALLHRDDQLLGSTYEVWTKGDAPELLAMGSINTTGKTLPAHTNADAEVLVIMGENEWVDVVDIQSGHRS